MLSKYLFLTLIISQILLSGCSTMGPGTSQTETRESPPGPEKTNQQIINDVQSAKNDEVAVDTALDSIDDSTQKLDQYPLDGSDITESAIGM